MITKIIACADIHIPALKGIDELKGILTKFVKKCEQIVEEEGPESVRIVVAGDIFHNKLAITNESILAAHWFFSQLDKICKTIVIIGNHDFLMNNMDRVDSLSPLFDIGGYKQVVFLDKELGCKSGIYDDDNVSWCLYSSFSGFNRPDIEAHKVLNKETDKKDNFYVGLIHGEVNGAITVTNYVSETGIAQDVFDGCDFVIAGHIHKRQELKKNDVKIVYCSSINQKDYGESITGHGFVIWDIDVDDKLDISYKYVDIPNEDGGFYKFEINDISDLENDEEDLINY
jgi:DNA repair exonuclease SbcCD nuclease subunit